MADVPSLGKLTSTLVAYIEDCCTAMDIAPADLQYGDFKRWLRQERDLDAAESRVLARHVTSVGGFSAIKNAHFMARSTAAVLEREEHKVAARVGRETISILAHHDLFERRTEELFTRMLKKHPPIRPFGYSFEKTKKVNKVETQRFLNLLLSDLHFGTWLDKREVPYAYGWKEESRRIASVIKRTCEFKRDYRDETELVVWLLGDLIKGYIHDISAGRCMAEQVADAVHILGQALTILAGEFKKVTVLCASGNHDRNVTRHVDRATAGKFDSFATHVYVALKAWVNHLPNITVDIPRTPHVEHSPFGHRIYGTHGDTCINPGNPGKSINIGSLVMQMATRNNDEVLRGQKPFGLYVVGHVHSGSLSHPAPADLITNGPLIPSDPFAVSIGHTQTKCGQYLWETTKSRIVGDSRFLEVDIDVDQDESLDKLIIPWNGDF
jgi:hypothetical protein